MSPATLPILTILVFLPLAGCLLLLPVWNHRSARPIAMGVALVEFLLALWIFASWQELSAAEHKIPGFYLLEDYSWIPSLGISFTLGMDGISLLMVLLTELIFVIAMLLPRNSPAGSKESLFLLLLLAMQSGITGVFLALDLALFYLFWEAMLIPVFFLIIIRGSGNRIISTIKFFIFTLAGSLFMLLAIIQLHLQHFKTTGVATFSLYQLLQSPVPTVMQLWLYAAFFLAFAIKIPLFPLHGWLPDSYSDAPLTGTLILSALMAKTGAYALIRFAHPLFPEAAGQMAPLLYSLALLSILYAAILAFNQTDIKRLIAWSSVSHMGFVALGIAAWQPVALSGSILQMVNHGITTGALFIMAGILEKRADSREINAFGGLWGKIPKWSFLFLFFSLASVGLPGLNNFVGEFLILAGTIKKSIIAASLAFAGLVLTLIYMLRLLQEVCFQKERSALSLSDLTSGEILALAFLALLCIQLGVHPSFQLDLLHVPVRILTGAAP
ncbi:MAG: NADH dehydrogenase [Geobacteraceae bacterium GWC2_48_7]|nr:MAG: NADH dehydrogenase [Geobacteraceae bacterium GWC2_48_7]